MKKITLLFIGLLLGTTITHAQNVVIPDANFKTALVNNFSINTNMDAEIQVVEAQAFTGALEISNKNIANLSGIGAFTSMTSLNCASNQLTTLDVSSCAALTTLTTHVNQLTTLILTPTLTNISCSYNQISALDLSANTALTHLHCSSNQLTTLNISTNTALTHLFCDYNQLTSIDISNNLALMELGIDANYQINTIDISNHIALTVFSCFSTQISNLNVNANPLLTVLNFGATPISSIDLSNNTALTFIQCNYTGLTNLDLSAHTSLTSLYCDNNQLLSTLNIKNGNNANMGNNNFLAYSNPNLTCIEVDSVAYSVATWHNIDSAVTFSTNCFTNTNDLFAEKINITTYPNPTNGKLTINLEKTYQNATVEVRNTIGQTVFSNTYNGVNQIDLNLEGAAGVYFVNIQTEQGKVVTKVIKE